MGLTARQLIRKNKHRVRAVEAETAGKADENSLGTLAAENANDVGVDIEFAVEKGIVLKSPNESRFLLGVDDAGTLTITPL